MYEQVLKFWFEESTPKQWFLKDEYYDEDIRKRFGQLHEKVSRGECDAWRKNMEGRLAEIIVLDQFSRNLYREDARAFAYDGMALVLAQEALATGELGALTIQQRSFLYMPYMHSESLIIHDKAMELFSEEGLEENYSFEVQHRKILQRFGRYPHRNKILGRVSTQEEQEFLKEPNSSF